MTENALYLSWQDGWVRFKNWNLADSIVLQGCDHADFPEACFSAALSNIYISCKRWVCSDRSMYHHHHRPQCLGFFISVPIHWKFWGLTLRFVQARHSSKGAKQRNSKGVYSWNAPIVCSHLNSSNLFWKNSTVASSHTPTSSQEKEMATVFWMDEVLPRRHDSRLFRYQLNVRRGQHGESRTS